MAKKIVVAFSADGSVIQDECSAEGIRQGDGNGSVSFEAVLKGGTNVGKVAMLHYRRPDGKSQANVVMDAMAEDRSKFSVSVGSAWFFAVAGTAKATVTITNSEGEIEAQGSYSFEIEATEVDVSDSTITYDEAAALEGLIASFGASVSALEKDAVKTASELSLATNKTALDFVKAAASASATKHNGSILDGERYVGTSRFEPNSGNATYAGEFFGDGMAMLVFSRRLKPGMVTATPLAHYAKKSVQGIWEIETIATESELQALFTDGSANKAIADGNGEVIADTYLKKTETAARATSDSDGNVIKNVYLKKTGTAAKAVADADGNEIKTTYSKVSDVQDTLSSAEATKPLSANKGRELNEKLNYKADLLDGKIPASQIPGSFADSESFASAKLVIVPNDTVLGLEYLVREDHALNNSEFMNKYNGIFDMNYGQIAYNDPMNVDLIGMVAIPQGEPRYALWAIKPMKAENGYYSVKEKVYVGRIYVDYTTNLEYRAKYGNDVYAFGKDPTFDDAFFQLSKGIAIGETADSAFAGNRGVALEESVSDLAQTKMDKSAVVDGLSSDSATDPLSARQGKALDEKKIDKADVIDSLDSDSSTSPLSARQGKALDEKKANVDGYYQEMGVGIADQLAATIGNETSDGYSFRPTGGGASVGNRATMKKIQAVSVVRNNMLRYANTITINGITFAKRDDNTYLVSGTATSDAYFDIVVNGNVFIENHKYLMAGCPANGSSSTYCLTNEWKTETDTGSGIIFAPTTNSNGSKNISCSIKIAAGYTANNLVFSPIFVDLTLFFGSNGRIPDGFTVADFFALVGNIPLEYDEGTLLSTDLSGFEAVGYNLLEIAGRTKGDAGEWSNNSVRPNLSESEYYVGMTANNFYNEERITSYSFIPNGLKINVKETGYGICFPVKVIAGQTYNLEGKDSQGNFAQRIGWYDKSGHLIEFDAFEVDYIPNCIAPNNAYWALIVLSPRSPNADAEITDVSFHLKRSGSRTGYEPYEKHDCSLSFQGNGIFPDAYHEGETLGDELTPDGTKTTNYGVLDLGDLLWDWDSGWRCFLCWTYKPENEIVNDIDTDDSRHAPRFLCTRYESKIYTIRTTKMIGAYVVKGRNEMLIIADLNYGAEDVDAFRESLKGVKLVYPLKKPTSEKSASYNPNVVVDDYGTERFLGNVPIARPTTLYQANLSEFVQSVYKNAGGDASRVGVPPLLDYNGYEDEKHWLTASAKWKPGIGYEIVYEWESGIDHNSAQNFAKVRIIGVSQTDPDQDSAYNYFLVYHKGRTKNVRGVRRSSSYLFGSIDGNFLQNGKGMFLWDDYSDVNDNLKTENILSVVFGCGGWALAESQSDAKRKFIESGFADENFFPSDKNHSSEKRNYYVCEVSDYRNFIEDMPNFKKSAFRRLSNLLKYKYQRTSVKFLRSMNFETRRDPDNNTKITKFIGTIAKDFLDIVTLAYFTDDGRVLLCALPKVGRIRK